MSTKTASQLQKYENRICFRFFKREIILLFYLIFSLVTCGFVHINAENLQFDIQQIDIEINSDRSSVHYGETITIYIVINNNSENQLLISNISSHNGEVLEGGDEEKDIIKSHSGMELQREFIAGQNRTDQVSFLLEYFVGEDEEAYLIPITTHIKIGPKFDVPWPEYFFPFVLGIVASISGQLAITYFSSKKIEKLESKYSARNIKSFCDRIIYDISNSQITSLDFWKNLFFEKNHFYFIDKYFYQRGIGDIEQQVIKLFSSCEKRNYRYQNGKKNLTTTKTLEEEIKGVCKKILNSYSSK